LIPPRTKAERRRGHWPEDSRSGSTTTEPSGFERGTASTTRALGPRRLLAIATAALFVAACIVEPPGPPSVTTDFAATLRLTHEAPVAVRTLEFAAAEGDLRVAGTDGYLEVVGEGGGGPGGKAYSDVWVSILNLASGVASDSVHGNGHASVDGWGHGISCDGEPRIGVDGQDGSRGSVPCRSTWTVIARWLEPTRDDERRLEINASLRAWAERVPPPGQPFGLRQLAITNADEPTFDGTPLVSSARVTGTATVRAEANPQTRRFLLRVPAELLAGGATYPRLGRVYASSDITDWSGRPMNLRLRVAFADRVTDVYGGIAGELDWLSACEVGVDCELPVELTIEPWIASSVATPPPDGVMAIDWLVEARFEDFSGGTDAPTGLELVEQP
jgi:hypothetical protein